MPDFQNTIIECTGGQVPVLDSFIKKLDTSSSNPKAEIIDHIIVQYDRKRSQAEKLEGRRFTLAGLLGLKRHVEYYRIDIYENAGVNFEQQYKLKHIEYGLVEITLKYTIAALEGSEEKLVTELARRNDPVSVLKDKLHEWVVKLSGEQMPNAYRNFEQFSNQLTTYLVRQAGNIGLKLKVLISYKADVLPPKETIRSTAKDVSVQPKGYNDFIKLGFEAVLIPDTQQQSNTLTVLGHKNRNEFQDLLVKWMQEYIREAESYNDITTALHFKVRERLIDYWNKQLRSHNKGWIIAELVMQSGDVPPANFKFERLEIEVALSNAKIPLVNTIILNLDNAELFKNSRINDLQEWVKEKLQQTAQNVLSRIPYAELVSRFEQLGSVIKSHLDKLAMQIGYRVEYMLTSELVDKARLNFQFQLAEEEQVFQTTLSEKVKLDIIITGRIKSLDHDTWRSTLTPETDFVLEMKKEVLREVRQLLMRMNADDFYTKFTEVVEPKLVEGIRKLLVIDFNVDESVDILPQMEVSAIRQLIIDLQRGHHTVMVNCFGEVAKFNVTFSVSAVDASKWTLFASRSYKNAADVIVTVGERIRIFVENAVRLMIQDVNVLRDARFFGLVRKYATTADEIVRDKMGLIIDIIDVEQKSNEMTSIVTEKSIGFAKEKINRLMNAIEKVDREILDAEENGDDDWEIEELTEKKKRLKQRLENEKFADYNLSDTYGKDDFNKLMNGTVDLKLLDNDTGLDDNMDDQVAEDEK